MNETGVRISTWASQHGKYSREELKEALVHINGQRCCISGEYTSMLDMHEWLVPRSALPIKRIQSKIFHPFNCIIISRAEHDAHDRHLRDYRCAQWAMETYDKENIEEWLNSLNLKTFGTFDQWLYRNRIK